MQKNPLYRPNKKRNPIEAIYPLDDAEKLSRTVNERLFNVHKLRAYTRKHTRDVNKDLTPKDQDKDKDLTSKDKGKNLKYVLKESLRTRTRTRTTARQIILITHINLSNVQW